MHFPALISILIPLALDLRTRKWWELALAVRVLLGIPIRNTLWFIPDFASCSPWKAWLPTR